MKTPLDEQMAQAGQFAPSIRMSGLLRMLALDIAIPVGGYYLARVFGAGMTAALLISTVLAGIRLCWLIWRQGRADAFAIFMLFLFGGGLTLSLITGDPRFLLLKGAALTVLSGLVFLGSVAVRRPLTFSVAQRLAGSDETSAAGLKQGWATSAPFRMGFYLMGIVWGVGLILSGTVQIALIYTLTLDQSVGATNIVALAVFAVCIGWNVWFVERSRSLSRDASDPQPEAAPASARP
ncbi:VC0807 family protein [Allobranchiibius sp. CTAmp26]|uniref:VC0807 family protein n=1 Tax=Allobranchiibius sp. CTAmp26 TaxID=2815214 RepID=UPI001AA14024|nr:VC0807 family protein [Allobranchiibius sp. CTAmp26]MBO1754905.1 hypothetical protein [Allobranchiibius sp. CTAmp26]